TADCKTRDDNRIKCANCQGPHSSASPECPKYKAVKQAWKMVAEEKLSYAEAIRKTAKVEKQAAIQQCSNMCSQVCRADVIDPPNSDQYARIPTAVRKNWAVSRKPAITTTIETQTDDE